MKNLLLVIIGIPFLSVSQEVISSQGDSYDNGSVSIAFTIGEPVIETALNGNNAVTQGFHQSNWKFVSLEDYVEDVRVVVYPNPLDKMLNIKMEQFDGMSYTMYSSDGKVVLQGELQTDQVQLSTGHLSPSTYTLVIYNRKAEKVKTIRLIKQN